MLHDRLHRVLKGDTPVMASGLIETESHAPVSSVVGNQGNSLETKRKIDGCLYTLVATGSTGKVATLVVTGSTGTVKLCGCPKGRGKMFVSVPWNSPPDGTVTLPACQNPPSSNGRNKPKRPASPLLAVEHRAGGGGGGEVRQMFRGAHITHRQKKCTSVGPLLKCGTKSTRIKEGPLLCTNMSPLRLSANVTPIPSCEIQIRSLSNRACIMGFRGLSPLNVGCRGADKVLGLHRSGQLGKRQLRGLRDWQQDVGVHVVPSFGSQSGSRSFQKATENLKRKSEPLTNFHGSCKKALSKRKVVLQGSVHNAMESLGGYPTYELTARECFQGACPDRRWRI